MSALQKNKYPNLKTTMLSTKLRTRCNRPRTTAPKSDFAKKLSIVKDILDVVLKIALILLPLPAIILLTYLRAIHRADLFASAVFSVSGLLALLIGSTILVACIAAGVFGPSWFIGQIAGTYDKSARPTSGAIRLALTAFVLALCIYLSLTPITNAPWSSTIKFAAKTVPALSAMTLLIGLAVSSPSYFQVLTEAERKVTRIRFGRAVGRALLAILGGVFMVSPIGTLFALAGPYRLPDDGWQSALAIGLLMTASVVPGIAYLYRRSRGGSRSRSILATFGAFILVLSPLILFRTSLEPIGLLTMSAMGVMETKPRTFELVSESERPTYQSLGFSFKENSKFFDARIRFQFGDIRLLCVDKYDAVSSWPGAVGLFKSPEPEPSAPPTGCITAAKDEVRVVDLPQG